MLTLFVVITLLVSALVGVVVIPRIIIISKKKKLFDEISEQKLHHGNIPRLGGVAFLPAFIFSVALIMGIRYFGGWEISAWSLETDVFREGMFLLAGLTMVFFTGLADDLTGLTYKSKFVVQIFVSLLLVYGGCRIGNLGGLFGIHTVPVAVGAVLTVLVCVLLMNAYNLIDGIDGLCSGLSLLTLGALGIWFTWNNLYVYGIMVAGIVGVVSVFFFYNVSGNRMKIFMGDTGSLTLGYLIAFFGLKFYNMNVETAMFNTPAAPAVFLGMVFIPVFDTIRDFFVRIKAG